MSDMRLPDGVFDRFYAELAERQSLLIGGAPGSGRTAVLHGILGSLLTHHSPIDTRLILIDAKGNDLVRYGSLPHVIACPAGPGEAVIALRALVSMIRERFDGMAAGGQKVFGGPDLWLVIDGLCDMAPEDDRELWQLLRTVLQTGWPARVHVIATDLSFPMNRERRGLDGLFPARLGLRTDSAEDSEALTGCADCAALPLGSGILAVNGETRKRSFVPVPEEKTRALIAYWAGYRPQRQPEEPDDRPGPARAADLALENGQISAASLQRSLRLGYFRSAALLDRLEALGVVSAPDDDGIRRCLIDAEALDEMKKSGKL